MKDNISKEEISYKKRCIGPQIQEAIKAFPVVVLSGARQSGKSTFLRHEFPDFKYLSLDDFSVLEQAKRDPKSLWVGAAGVVIDEAQKAPDILSAVKLSVDQAQRRIRFLISGSSNLLLMKRVSESLAGRAVYFEMLPMSHAEMEGTGGSHPNFMRLWETDLRIKEVETDQLDPVPLMLRGFMPPLLYLRDLSNVLLWWEGYIRTYLERDIRDLSQLESLVDFKRVLDAVALRTGNVLNLADIARMSGVSHPTVFRYVKLLEVSNILNRVPSFHRSKGKRLIKSPKVFFVDPALGIYLSGYHDHASLRGAREVGGFFETLVFLHLKILSELMVPKAGLYYWRTTTGKEVDFVVEHGKRVIAFEVKLTKNPNFGDIGNLLGFMEEHPHAVRGILVHAGSSIKYLHSKVLAVPWWWLTASADSRVKQSK